MSDKFFYEPIEFTQDLNLKATTINGKRYYIFPSNNSRKEAYISVTSALSILNKESIQRWQNRIGITEANKITSTAAGVGKSVHKMIEVYLKGTIKYDNSTQVSVIEQVAHNQKTFLKAIPTLNKINVINCLEQILYSDTLRLAGRVDCIGIYDGVPSIIDFKTSIKPKNPAYLDQYFLQTTCYSLMLEELTGKTYRQLVIISIPQDGEVQVFINKRKDYYQKLKEVLNDVRGTQG